MKKRIFAILTAAAMILVLLPATMFAATVSVGTEAQLASAITAAASGDTIKLTAAITGIQQMEISKTITIDMNGFNISGNPSTFTAFRVVAGGDLTLSNSSATQSRLLVGTGLTDEYNYEGIRIAGAGKATVGAKVSIETGLPVFIIGNGTAGSAQLDVYGKLVVTAVIVGGEYDGFAYSAIQGNGTAGYGGTIINIYIGAEILNTFSNGLYIPQSGVVNVFGGTITGKDSAIAIKAGTLNIYGGTLSATGPVATLPPAGWSNGINASGCAIQIESNDGYAGNIVVNITGGTIGSANGYALYEYLDDGTTDGVARTEITMVNRITVSGGTLMSAGTLPDMLLSDELTAKGVVTTNGTEVTSGVDDTYTIIIPAKVDFGTLARGTGLKEESFTVSAENVVIGPTAKIDVKVTSSFTMLNGTTPLAYKLYKSGSVQVASTETFASFAAGTLAQSEAGKVTVDTAEIVYSGDYSGIMTFAITLG